MEGEIVTQAKVARAITDTPQLRAALEVQLRQAAAREALGKYVTNLRDKANIVQ